MSLRKLSEKFAKFGRRASTERVRTKRPGRTSGLRMEPLEERRLLAVLYVDDSSDYAIDVDQGAVGLDAGDTVTFQPGAGSSHGGNVPGLIFGTDAFTSIASAIAAATPGSTINVGPGTFNEALTVNKQLSLRGNQFGVDARTRVAAETVMNNSAGAFYITASNVSIDGFKLQDQTNGAWFGYATVVAPTTTGTQIVNNIFTNNIIGLSLANTGANQFLVKHNLFENNNQPGPASGNAIYADEYSAGGTLSNVLIEENKFVNQNTSAVNLAFGVDDSALNITIQNNELADGGVIQVVNGLGINISGNSLTDSAGITLSSTTNANIQNNVVTSDDSATAGIRLSNGSNGIVISGNTVTGGAADGIRIRNSGAASFDVDIINNILSGNAGYGLQVQAGGYTGTLDLADLTLLTNTLGGGLIDTVAVLNVTGTTGAVVDTFTINGVAYTHDRAGSLQQSVAINQGAVLNVFGNDGNDVFNVAPATNAQATQINIDGGSPVLPASPGDALNVDLTGVAGSTLDMDGASAGDITSTSHATVAFTSIESLDFNPVPVANVIIDANDDPAPGSQAGDGVADGFLVQLNGANVEVWVNGSLVFSEPLADLDSLTINGSSPDTDTLTVNNANGVVNLPINFNGGAGGNDKLVITGTPAGPAIASEIYIVGATEDAGIWILDPNGNVDPSLNFDGDELVVTFSGLEPVDTDVAAANFTVLLTNLADSLTLEDGGLLNGVASTQVTDNGGTFETFRFANKTNVSLNGLDGADYFHLNVATAAAGLSSINIYGNEFTDGAIESDDLADDTFRINGLAATVTASLFGDGGNDLFTSVSGEFDGVNGGVSIFGGAGLDRLIAQDNSTVAVTGETITVTSTQILGIAVGSLTYNNAVEGVFVEGTTFADTINILSTSAATQYVISGGGDSDTIAIGNQAADVGVVNDGSLDAILGVLTIVPDNNGTAGDDDVLLLDDSGTASLFGNASIANIGFQNAPFPTLVAGPAGDTTELAGFAPASIFYVHGSTTNAANNRLERLVILTSTGTDTVDVVDTTATVQTTLDVFTGDDSSTVTINADGLSAHNVFVGNTGNDNFILNINFDIGAASVFPVTGLQIEGNAPADDTDNRDRITINDNSFGGRTLDLNYLSQTSGDLDIIGYAIPVNLLTLETLIFNGSGNDDFTVNGTAGDDQITVAAIGENDAMIFLGGNPWDGPDDAESFANAIPGIGDGGSGPDIRLNNFFSLLVDGGAAGAAGNQIFVYGTSENDLVDAGTTDDLFGFGAGVVLPGFGVGNAYDDVLVQDNFVGIYNPLAFSIFSPFNLDINAASFAQANPNVTFGLIVNTGDEAAPDADGVGDHIDVELSFILPIQINGGDPDPINAPLGDHLHVFTPAEINVFNDKAVDPNDITITSDGSFGLNFSSIEYALFTPGNGVVNLVGDNNDPALDQSDTYNVVGGDFDGDPDDGGYQEFSLQINGSSPAIYFDSVQFLNAFGDDQNPPPGTPSLPPHIDTLNVTPYADNTPRGWGIDVRFDEGNPTAADGDEDLLVYNGVPGVSELIVVQASGPDSGQIIVTDANTGTVIVIIDYTTNTGIIINGNDGSAGDTDRLVLRGTDGTTSVGTSGDDTVIADFTALGDAANPLVRVLDGAAVLYHVINITNIDLVKFELDAGNDTMTLTPGAFTVVVDGGTPVAGGTDTLTVNVPGNVRYTQGVNASEGVIDQYGGDEISVAGIERINFVTAAAPAASTLTVRGTDDNDTIAAQTLGGTNLVWINDGPVLGFGPSTASEFGILTLQGRFGDDSFSIAPMAGVIINVQGGDPVGSDEVVIAGTVGTDTIVYSPTAADAGSVQINALGVINLTTVEHLKINGLGGNDVFTLNTPANPQRVEYTPGAVADAATLTIGNIGGGSNLLGVEFSNLGNTGSFALTNTGGGRVDEFVLNGTDADDSFNVVAPSTVQVVADPGGTALTLALALTGARALVLRGKDGDDTFNVVGNHAFGTGIFVEGGNPSDGDLLNFTGNGGAVNLNLAGSINETGFGQVFYSGLAALNTDTQGNALNVLGLVGDNIYDVTPLGTNSLKLQANGASPLITAGDLGAFNLNLIGSNDTLVVNATAANETINVTGALVDVVGLQVVNYLGAEALVVNGHQGNDLFLVTPAAIPIFIDGGDPIGSTPGDRIQVVGGGAVTLEAGPENDEGGIIVGLNARISFDHIEGITVGPGPDPLGCILILGTNGDDDITVIARDGSTHVGADGVRDFTVSLNGGPAILFLNAADLYIDALSGDDDVVIRAGAPNAAVWDVNVFVAGGAPSAVSPGDRLVVETPGVDTVVYTPTGSDAGTLEIVNLSTVIAIGGGFAVPCFPLFVSSAGGFEHLIYDGESDGATNDNITIVGGAGYDIITHTPGIGSDEGTFRVNNSLALVYQNVGNGANLTVDGGADGDRLVVNGTDLTNTFTVNAAGSVAMNGRVTINQVPGSVSDLTLNGLDGDDFFQIGANPYTSIFLDGGNPAASDTLELTGTAAAENVVMDYGSPIITISGIGGLISLNGVEHINLLGNGGTDTLTVAGRGGVDDVFRYTPSSASGGRLTKDNSNTDLTFNIGAGVANTFTISGGLAGLVDDKADKVVLNGTNNHDVITINMAARTGTVENAAGTEFKAVTLHNSVEILDAMGLLGNDTFLVIPAPALEVNNGFPINLLVNVDGGQPGASDALVIGSDANGAALPATDFAVVNRGGNPGEGVVRVFRNAVQMPDISYTGVEVVSPNVFVDANGDPQLLILGYDGYEPNEFRTNAAYLGSGQTINVPHLAIFPNAVEHPFVPADNDYFRLVAQTTGIMDFQVYFRQFNPALLPAGGDLQIEVRDEDGTIISGFGTNDTDDDERVRIPVVAGKTYYLRVFGNNPAGGPNLVVNGYDLTVTNSAPPVPFDIELDDTLNTGSDTGRSQFDDVTRDNTPTIFLRLDDAIFLNDLPGNGAGGPSSAPDEIIPIPHNPAVTPFTNVAGFRIAIYDETNTHNPVFVGYAQPVVGQPGVYSFTFSNALVDGSHFLSARVEMIDPTTPASAQGFGARSVSLEIIVDTVAPPTNFGEVVPAFDGLDPSSDTGVIGQPATFVDRITSDTTPSFYGRAEADAIVRLFADTNNNGVYDVGVDLFLGETVASPLDGSNQFPGGQWNLTTTVDLNNPTFFPVKDGVRRLFVTGEDLAGNVSVADTLVIFIDTAGPQIDDVVVPGHPGFDIFANKDNGTLTPTPLIFSLDVMFIDNPIRRDAGPGNVFVYPAVNEILAENVGNYYLVGDATGVVTIVSAVMTDFTVVNGIGRSTVRLTFASPLPDDRFTLVVNDSISDDPGNALDGESQASSPFGGGGIAFPTGDGTPGGDFNGRFTVDSRPEMAVYSSGSVAVDINGNFYFDPGNPDAVNRDLVFNLGFASDRLFTGNFRGAGGMADGFDKLGVYGFVNGQWRFLLDRNNDGVISIADGDINQVTTLQIDGLPFAGDFVPGLPGDEVAVFDGTKWYIDTNGNFDIDPGDLILTGNMRGYPIAGDFDGNGFTDLGTWSQDKFFFDLADAAGNLTGNTDATINFGFTGVLERPVAADMDQDGIDDIGLWVPGRSQQIDRVASEWYFLVSGERFTAAEKAPHFGTVNFLNHPFEPIPFGDDIFAQYGDEFGIPLLGNFDPPITEDIEVPGDTAGLVNTLYQQILGRVPQDSERDYWTGRLAQGMSYVDLAAGFINSVERRSKMIDELYVKYLGRSADAGGIEFWLKVWADHKGPEYVQAGIIGSQEFYDTAGGTDESWVTALYQNILGRAPEQAGLDYWTNHIKTNTRASVVLGFVTSNEYRLEIITGWYMDYLNRQIDVGGGQYWVEKMRNGMKQEALQIMLISSEEYRNNI